MINKRQQNDQQFDTPIVPPPSQTQESDAPHATPTWHRRTVASLLICQAFLLAWIGWIKAPVFDEIAHVPSGLSHWATGDFSLYRVNPPLIRMLATIPLLAIQPKTDWKGYSEDPYARPEFIIGRRFMDANDLNAFWYYTLCRWMLIPIVLFGGWICYLWASELFGRRSGIAALALWCFSPNILGWGAINTPDVGAAVFGVTAVYTFRNWLLRPSWATCSLAGTCLGAAELTKSTWIILFELWPLAWLSWRIFSRHSSSPQPSALQLAGVLLLGLYLLNLGYGFEGSFSRLDSFKFISESLGGTGAHEIPGSRFENTSLGWIPVPLPANYVKGIDVQKYDFEVGKWSYLRGETKHGGWWYWYIYALLVKSPLGTLFLLAVASVLFCSRRFRVAWREELALILPALVVLVFVSSQTGFNRYLRYVIPIIPFCLIFASRVFNENVLRYKLLRLVGTIVVIISAIESLWVYPHSMSFFNRAVGGPTGGPSHLLDANIDWGQDLLLLKDFVRKHSEIGTIRLAYFGMAEPEWAEFPFEPAPKADELNGNPPPPGWYAVSVNHVYGYRHNEHDKPWYAYFAQYQPRSHLGYSIYVYEINGSSKSTPQTRNVNRMAPRIQ